MDAPKSEHMKHSLKESREKRESGRREGGEYERMLTKNAQGKIGGIAYLPLS